MNFHSDKWTENYAHFLQRTRLNRGEKKELIMNSEIGNIKIVRLLIRWFVASPMIINSIARNSQETSNRLGIGGNDWWDELVADDKKMRARERRIGKLNVQHRHQRWVLPLETEQTKRTTRKYEMSNPKIYANCILNVAGLKQCARHRFAVSPGFAEHRRMPTSK